MEPFVTALKSATRRLVRTPGFSLVAGLTLALGLAANIAIFTVLNSVVLRPLPYPESDQLYSVYLTATGLGMDRLDASTALFHEYRRVVSSFESIGMFAKRTMNLTGLDAPERLTAAAVSTDLFPTLRVAPALGRDFNAEDEQRGSPPVAMVSNTFWRTRLNAAPDVIGRTVTLDQNQYEIVGVMPAGFAFPEEEIELWFPITIDPQRVTVAAFDYAAIGRLAPGATPDGAVRDIERVVASLPDRYPRQAPRPMMDQMRIGGAVAPYRSDVIGDISTRLWILFATVGLVLLIACANVANLYLVRTENRRREIALRTALGATPADLARVFFAESVVLAAFGGLLALGCAWAAVRLFVGLGPEGVPRLHEIGMTGSVVLYGAVVAALAAGILGVFPLLRSRMTSIVNALKEGGRTATEGRGRHLIRHALVVVQVSLAMVLLVGSGLLLRSFFELRSVDPGFESGDLMTMQVALPSSDYRSADRVELFFRTVRNQLAAQGGVRSVGVVTAIPLGETGSRIGYWIEGISSTNSVPLVNDTRAVSAGYFETMRIPLIAGRRLEDRDALNDTRAVVVSESFARKYWNTTEVVGRRLKTAQGVIDGREPWSTIVGVVGDVRSAGLSQEPEATVYLPMLNAGSWFQRSGWLVVASDLATGPLLAQTRATMAGLDANLPIANVQTMDEVVQQSMARESFTALLLSVAAALAVLLGAVGIYGVISYIVTQRTPELGVRVALGARAADVVGMVMKQSLLVAAIGVAVGMAGALAAGQVLRAFLFGVTPYDVVTLTLVPVILLITAAAASLLPARRAGRVDPARAMRAA